MNKKKEDNKLTKDQAEKKVLTLKKELFNHCVSCEKKYEVKHLRDGVCDKCLSKLVIRKWL